MKLKIDSMSYFCQFCSTGVNDNKLFVQINYTVSKVNRPFHNFKLKSSIFQYYIIFLIYDKFNFKTDSINFENFFYYAIFSRYVVFVIII